MTTIPLATSDWRRSTAKEPIVKVQNRFFEENPTNLVEGSSLIMRPGTHFEQNIEGYDPANHRILGMYSQEGVFDNSSFVLTPTDIYQLNSSAATVIGHEFWNGVRPYSNQATFTSAINDVPSYFYAIDNNRIFVKADPFILYNELNLTGSPEVGAKIRIGDMYYEYTSGSVNTGSPDGSSGNPWLVSTAAGMESIATAVGASVPGSAWYSSATTPNPRVNLDHYTSTKAVFYAKLGGNAAGTIPSTITGSTNFSWSAGASFTGSFNRMFIVDLPESSFPILPVAITTLNSYVIIGTTGGYVNEYSGRFYWIEPGENHINPLNFATAEMSPDSIVSIRTVGEELWIIGRDSVEVWYTTGDPVNPFRRNQGKSLSVGGVPGSDCVINNTLMFVSSNIELLQCEGSSIKSVSRSSEEEQLRKFLYDTTNPPPPLVDTTLRSTYIGLDGHLMYVLYLGLESTIVYDLATSQFSNWVTYGDTYFRPHAACTFFYMLGQPTIAGDIMSGTLWRIDEDYRFDALVDGSFPAVIECVVTAGIPMRQRETALCSQLYLTGSVGEPIGENKVFLTDGDGYYLTDGDGYFLIEYDNVFIGPDNPNLVRLEYSDDNGKTFVVADADVELITDAFKQEVVWRSIGHVSAPGRVFRITDYGSLPRIDGLDMS